MPIVALAAVPGGNLWENQIYFTYEFIENEFSTEISSPLKRTSCLSRDFNLADWFKIMIMHTQNLSER